jgi:hypothetical protein
MRHVETMETRRMMSVTTPDSLLLGGPDTRPAGNEVATEELVIVHEGLKPVSLSKSMDRTSVLLCQPA